ncbi:MAG: alpha-amylase family glycosyl hydrolase [Gemmatirosa sp.]
MARPRVAPALLRAATVLLPLVAMAGAARAQAAPVPASRAAWTRGAVCYEVFVRSFQDSDGDGIGDLAGLIQRLDYINDGSDATQRDLGARCIWLMPVAASPSYHGYDVTDHYRVEPDYGTNADFRRLVAEAHRRGIRVLVDMVLNHASSEHPHFVEALRDTLSPYRAWFRFSPTRPDVKGPWGQEVWHKSPVRDEWYYGVFWSGMPDLNYAAPPVRAEAERIARFWLDSMGVDGFRLDAIPYLVEDGSRLHHTPATHAVLRDYAAAVRRTKRDAFTIGEVWDSTGAMLPYYPDQLDAHFAFEVADGIIAAVKTGSAKGLLPPVLRLQRALPADRWAPFLRNHDQPRTRTELGGDPSTSMARARLASALMLTMPGVPFVYYGEEIGMVGNKPDERLRTPMHWNREASTGFTRGKPWQPLQDDSLVANVAAQDGDPRSILSLHRRLIHLRARHAALGTGELLPLTTSTDTVAAYVRRAGNRAVLVVANLGAMPARGVTLTSDARVLTAGRYAPRSLLGGPAGAALRLGTDGRLRGYAPLPVLAPFEVFVFDLVRTGR